MAAGWIFLIPQVHLSLLQVLRQTHRRNNRPLAEQQMLSRASRNLLLRTAPLRQQLRPSPIPPAQMSTSHSTPTTPSATPLEDTIRSKLTSSLNPTQLTVTNDSHLHAHHAAMQTAAYAAARETHFRVHIVSAAFEGKMQPARHRMVYRLLEDEMRREGGVHALQLVTRTGEEEEEKKKGNYA